MIEKWVARGLGVGVGRRAERMGLWVGGVCVGVGICVCVGVGAGAGGLCWC